MTLWLLSDSYHPYVSGVVRSVALTASELARRGHRVLIVAPAYPPLPPAHPRVAPEPPRDTPAHDRPDPEPTGVQVVRLPSLPAPGAGGFRIPLPCMGPVLQAMQQTGLTPDVIHVHSPFVTGSLALRLRRRTGAPVVFTHHTLYHLYAHYARLPRRLVRWWTRRHVAGFCRQVDAVVAPSRAVAQLVRQLYGAEGLLRVVPTGLDLRPFAQAPREPLRQRLAIPPRAPVLLHVGRLAPEKNVAVLLEALFQVLQALPDAHALVVGGGPLEAWVRRQAAGSPSSGRIHVAGPVAPEEVPAWYAAADLFITASTTETQGLVAVEAMAAGLPVVAPDAFGLRDVVADGRSGYLVPARDQTLAQALAEAALRLLQSLDLRQAMARAARQEAARYDIRETVSALLALYEEVRSARAPTPSRASAPA